MLLLLIYLLWENILRFAKEKGKKNKEKKKWIKSQIFSTKSKYQISWGDIYNFGNCRNKENGGGNRQTFDTWPAKIPFGFLRLRHSSIKFQSISFLCSEFIPTMADDSLASQRRDPIKSSGAFFYSLGYIFFDWLQYLNSDWFLAAVSSNMRKYCWCCKPMTKFGAVAYDKLACSLDAQWR